MKDTYFLIFTKHGIDRMVKNAPTTLKATERAIQMNFEVSDEVFTPFSIPKVSVTVPTEAVTRTIQAEIQESQ